jgi:hypothetical protein
MSDITATVSSQPITATVSASGNISASVGSSVVTANVGGGMGPQGASGAAGGTLDQLNNVQIVSAQNGDLLRYNANKWTNVSETQVTDGGNV